MPFIFSKAQPEYVHNRFIHSFLLGHGHRIFVAGAVSLIHDDVGVICVHILCNML
jgi:hypothetical protein